MTISELYIFKYIKNIIYILMNISKTINTNLEKLLDLYKKETNTELEAVVWGTIFKNRNISHNSFLNVINYFKNNLELSFTNTDTLTIYTDSSTVRTTISGIDNIKMYWLTNKLDKLDNIEYLNKKRRETVELMNYSIRINYKDEIPVIDADLKKLNAHRIADKNELKTFRFRNRLSFEYKDFIIDLTTVKMSKGRTFKSSNCLRMPAIYEIEIEFKKNTFNSTPDTLVCFLELLGSIITILQDGTTILSETQIKSLQDDYKRLTNSNEFILADAVSIEFRNIIKSSDSINIYNNYAVTYKADGERHCLFIDSTGNSCLIDNNSNFKGIDIEISGWNNTLIEGEYLSDKDIFLMYDILFAKGEDVRGRKLNISMKDKKTNKTMPRIELVKQFSKEVKNNITVVLMKDYKYGNGEKIFDKSKELLELQESLPYNIDGLIYTPIDSFYPIKTRRAKWEELLKWKPEKLNSIDFLVKYKKDDLGNDLILPHFIDDGIKKIIRNYKTLILYVGTNADKFNKKNKKFRQKTIPGKFIPDKSNPDKYCEAKIFVKPNNKIYTYDFLTNEEDEIKDDIIVEFGYDIYKKDFNWNPLRIRYDKTEEYKRGVPKFGNFETTAIRIWKTIQDPITEYMITTGSIPKNKANIKSTDKKVAYYTEQTKSNRKNTAQKRFHNDIKRELIKSVAVAKTSKYDGTLLDLASGRGGDMLKWRDAKFKKIIGLDIDKAGLRVAQDRYKDLAKPKPNIYYSWADSRELIFPDYAAAKDDMSKLRLEEYIPTKYSFDVVSMMFALHYMFKDETTLKNFLQNVSDNLKIGGHFIGTCFDGERIFNLLKEHKGFVEEKDGDEVIWSIQKKYRIRTFNLKKPQLGIEIEVYYQTFGQPQIEYLVNFTYFEKMCAKYKLKLVSVKPFEEYYKSRYKLSDEGKVLSFLHNTFTFVKL